MALKHNKKKNTCVVYEQMLTLAARLAAKKDVQEFNFVSSFIKENFRPGTLIGKEKKVLEALVNARRQSNVDELVEEALKESKTIDSVLLESEKVKLINKINSVFGADFFKMPIKDYKLYASAQILVNEERSGYKFSTPEERVKIKKTLKENISQKVEKEDTTPIDSVTYKILINKYNQKYGPFLNENQKYVLSEWIKSEISDDKNGLVKILEEKRKEIASRISISLKRKDSKAAEYYELLKEAEYSIKTKDFSVLNEDVIYEMLRYFDLMEDLENKNDSEKVHG